VLERLTSYDEVVAASGGDPYTRWGIDPAKPLDGGARDGAVAWTVRREHYAGTPWLNSLGPPEVVAALVTELLAGERPLDPQPRGITVPFGTMALLADAVRPPEHGDWTWWWTDSPPPPEPAEPLVEVLDVAGDQVVRQEVAALLREANPNASADVDDGAVRTWVGVREPAAIAAPGRFVGTLGRLVAVGADRPMFGTVPHLASIATSPAARGRGYGGAVTAALLRRRLIDDEAAVVTLGMYSDNDTARSVYLRLGLRPEHRFTSGDLPHARGAPS
jgi:ribosomal protein S18 acetylase RimI-like enzyme